jgi:hypothetical protein
MRALSILTALALLGALAGCRKEPDGDGDADADGDSDSDADEGDGGGDSDADQDDGGGICVPELGVCDPIAQCGCEAEAGTYCEVGLDGETVVEYCAPDQGGTAVQGDDCSAATCAPGNVCVQTGETTIICLQWCIDDPDCEAYLGSQCSLDLGASPYLVCSPENESMAPGTASYSVCIGDEGECPGNPPHPYEITDAIGTCSVERTDPMTVTFTLYDEAQGISVTANKLAFTPDGDAFVPTSNGGFSRFSMFFPDDDSPYTTTELSTPSAPGGCEVMVHFDEAEAIIDVEFTCEEINRSFTNFYLTTLDGDAVGAGTLSMNGCAVIDPGAGGE